MRNSLLLAACGCVLASAEARAESVLLSDTFNADNGAIESYDRSGQSGSLAPLGYTLGGYAWQTEVSGNALKLWAGGPYAPSVSPAHDFAGVDHLRIEVNGASNPIGQGWVSFGTDANALFTVPTEQRFQQGGAALVFNYYQGRVGGYGLTLFVGSTAVYADTTTLGVVNDFQIDMVALQSGDTAVDIVVNGTYLDLNGAAAGKSYVIAEQFTKNYVTLGHEFFAGSGIWYVDGYTISAIPEPSTYGLMLGGLALAGAAIRRRKISK